MRELESSPETPILENIKEKQTTWSIFNMFNYLSSSAAAAAPDSDKKQNISSWNLYDWFKHTFNTNIENKQSNFHDKFNYSIIYYYIKQQLKK